MSLLSASLLGCQRRLDIREEDRHLRFCEQVSALRVLVRWQHHSGAEEDAHASTPTHKSIADKPYIR